MKVGRNDPCPCGSGKKYKKCCLSKDQLIPTAPPPVAEAPEPITVPIEDDWQEEETLDEGEAEAPGDFADEPEELPLQKYPKPDMKLPDLPPEQEKIIEDWWKETSPCYEEQDADQMIQRVETALTEFPSLFVHLALDEEFLFELGGELGRRGRMPDFIALLQRLRREQRRMYSFSYGAFDSDVIAELVVTGQVEQIPAYLDLFKQYPDAQPDYCHYICNLLAWRGLAEPLYLLCEAVATPLMTSSEVIGGNFALGWLFRREEIPFYEGGDGSPGALERTVDSITRLGERIQIPLRAECGLAPCGIEGLPGTPTGRHTRHPHRPGSAPARVEFRFAFAPHSAGSLGPGVSFERPAAGLPLLVSPGKNTLAAAPEEGYRGLCRLSVQSVPFLQRRDPARDTSRHGLVCRVSGNRHCDLRRGSRTDQAGLSAAIRGQP